MDEKIYKTEWRLKKEARELAIYDEWKALMGEPGAMATAVNLHLTQKYGFGSDSTIWFIRKRVEKRLNEGGKE
jgi:hypothetical protein